jgi:putative redox protein
MIVVNWIGDRAFEAQPPSGNRFVLDSHSDAGGKDRGPTPLEAFLASGAACSAIDVITILEKKRLTVTSYRIEVEGEREEVGEYPRPYKSIVFRHILTGPNLDSAAVAHAVGLSDQKYCSVIATLRFGPKVSTVWEISATE